MKSNIAFFISPHGYGHAARASALMSALCDLDPGLGFEIFTTIPVWFFHDSIPGRYKYHTVNSDIGLLQKTPFEADLPGTLDILDRFLPFDEKRIKALAEKVVDRACCLMICDISPMGIAVAGEAGIPSVLVENFTWDWIYEEYIQVDGRFEAHIRYLREIFEKADYHIQARPLCEPRDADLVTLPISRKQKTHRDIIRERLGIPKKSNVVMVTSGGIQERYNFLKGISELKDLRFIIPSDVTEIKRQGNIDLIPHHSQYFHPDLLHASDAVIGKVGYSTLSEVYYAGIPFGYIVRENFRESDVLADYIEREMKGIAIRVKDFYEGAWTARISDLLAMPKLQRHGSLGADQAADFVYGLMKPKE